MRSTMKMLPTRARSPVLSPVVVLLLVLLLVVVVVLVGEHVEGMMRVEAAETAVGVMTPTPSIVTRIAASAHAEYPSWTAARTRTKPTPRAPPQQRRREQPSSRTSTPPFTTPFSVCPTWNTSTLAPNITIGSFSAPGGILPSSLITDALAAIPKPNPYPYVIALGANVFNGTALNLNVDNVALIGCGAQQTYITAALGRGIVEATLTVHGNDVTLEHMHIANTWDDPWELGPNPPPVPKNVSYCQAVALNLQGERTAMRHIYLYGYQDTLYTVSGTAYLFNSTVLGRVDFIFGSGVLFLERTRIDAIPGGYITAGSTPDTQTYGIVFVNCYITFNASYGRYPTGKVGLGRTWHQNPMVTYINTTIDGPDANILDHPWVSMGNETINGTGTSVCNARLSEYNTIFRDGSTVYTKDHPQSCPLTPSPIVAATSLPASLQAFYKKSAVLGGWNPSTRSILRGDTAGEGDEGDFYADDFDVDDHVDEDDHVDPPADSTPFAPTAPTTCAPWRDASRLPPNVTIGSFSSPPTTIYPTALIIAALATVPTPNLYPFVIALSPGVFTGDPLHVRVGNVSLIGCGVDATFLQYANSTNLSPTLPAVYYDVATLMIEADDVTIEHMHIANTWNDPWELGPDPPPVPKNVSRTQAVALVFNANRIAVRHAYIYGFQDTLLTAAGTAYMYNCTVLGCVDFIFGAGTVYMERSRIDAIPGGWLTAMMTPADTTYGAVLESCHVTFNTSYGRRKPSSGVGLGRTWHQYPMVTYINTTLADDVIILEHPWVSMGNETINGTGTSVCNARLSEYNTMFPDGSTAYIKEHPQSCPLANSPIIAAAALPADLQAFYAKSAVLVGWNPPAHGTEASRVEAAQPRVEAMHVIAER